MQQFFSNATRKRNLQLNHRENMWASGAPGDMPILDLEAVIDKVVYIALQPVAAYCVEKASQWTGFKILPSDRGKPMRFKRPEHCGDDMPEYIEFTPMPPPGFDHLPLEEVIAFFEDRIARAEKRYARKRRKRPAFDDNVLWHEAISMTFDPQTDTAEKEYRVETSPNLDHGRVDLPRDPAPPIVDADVAPLLAGTQPASVSLFVRDFPRWAPPVRIAAAVVSLADSAERAAARVAYREQRAELLSVRTQELRELLETSGAIVVKTDPVVGSLTVDGPGRNIAAAVQAHAAAQTAIFTTERRATRALSTQNIPRTAPMPPRRPWASSWMMRWMSSISPSGKQAPKTRVRFMRTPR